ncbi:hypothetical protein BVRB_013860 [Beta vulgaris subsp. vulgaris]|uniref:Protein kinase domain-containing protein n=1 Tax=Beta vulgaris subsp. vulgaris TaxID=3555 RepID=A0A0J8DVQ9_BETVV|nr:hypothetical protein BVRB_013860 [Beta vulgaris subsp. vulgaris]
MHPSISCSTIFIFLLCFLTSTSSKELLSLLNFKSHLQTTNVNLFSSWLPSNPTCNFTGISCNNAGNITGIDLSKQALSGTIHFQAICSIPSLQKLDLGFNSLSGNITLHIRNCTQLEYLNLGNNNFFGSFPDISPLHQLKFLYLQLSGFSGVFPWNSLSNITQIIQLSLGDNPFDITLFPKQITQLQKLNLLHLYNTSISGLIPPEIGNLSELIDLELSNNSLSGSIPPEISKLKNLRQLILWGNTLTGIIPVGFRNLTNLQQFDASINSLTGDLSELKYLNQITSLVLNRNNFSGSIPPEFGDFKKLMNLSLYNNKLTGKLPAKIGSWAEFDYIDVSANLLTGAIPPDMCKKGTMTKLLMIQNNFSGEIPASYAACSTLNRFRVSDNLLTGEVPPGIWGLPNLETIDIAHNQLRGPITRDISKAKKLLQIYASNNELSGVIPVEISDASSLVLIDVSKNQLTGKVPESVGKLKNINSLYLQENQLSGDIPASLADCLHLSELNLAQNSFSGHIPISLGSLPTLTSLNLSHNKLLGVIPGTLSSLRLSLLDLSYNKLSGPIPGSLSVEAYNGGFIGNDGLCSRNPKLFRPCPSRPRDHYMIFLVVGIVLLIVFTSCYVCMKLHTAWKDKKRSLLLNDDDLWNMKSYHMLNFTKEEILKSIKPENLIAKGGCGSVYRVILRDGQELAVKHIWYIEFSDDEKKNRASTPILDKNGGSRSRKMKEFEMEVQTLSSIRHINILKLYCSITSNDSSLLVYEFLSNGSLWDRLHNSTEDSALDWQSRYEIALGAARGLEYLHHGYEKPNVVCPNSTHVVAGTYGYIAPEYGYTSKVNEKCDVYSFGVVLLELVTGKRPINEPEFRENDIVDWVSIKLRNSNVISSIIDSSIMESENEEVIKVLKIAIFCTRKLPELRPTMKSVVQMLEEAAPSKLVPSLMAKAGQRR